MQNVCAQQICTESVIYIDRNLGNKMPGRIRLPEALPKLMSRSDHIFPAAPASCAVVLRFFPP